MEITRVAQLAWRRFLSTEHGTAGLLHLREMTPTVQKGAEHEMVFDSGRVEGYRIALDRIYELVAAEQDKQDQLENP